MPETILVTGGAGFIGSHLVERLLGDGHDVYVVDDLSSGSLGRLEGVRKHPRFHLVVDSILNWPMMNDTVDRVDRVVHLAAVEGIRRNLEKPIETMKTNVRGAEIVLDVSRRRGVPVFLASSADVYGTSSGILNEDQELVIGNPREWRWWQATTKLLDECLALAHHREADLPVVIGRFFNVVGPRQSGRWGTVLPTFVRAALEEEPLEVYGTGEQRRSFVHVADVVEAIVGLQGEPAAVGEIFNIGTEEEISIRKLAERVKERTGSSSEVVTVKHPEEFGPDFEDLERKRPDLTRIREVLGWEPRRDLNQTIDEVAAYFRRRLEEAG